MKIIQRHTYHSYLHIQEFPDEQIDITNKDMMCRIIAGMSKVENGREAVMSDVVAGWILL